MRSFAWNCPECGAIYSTYEPPGMGHCVFCKAFFRKAPAYVVDGDDL